MYFIHVDISIFNINDQPVVFILIHIHIRISGFSLCNFQIIRWFLLLFFVCVVDISHTLTSGLNDRFFFSSVFFPFTSTILKHTLRTLAFIYTQILNECLWCVIYWICVRIRTTLSFLKRTRYTQCVYI